MMKQKRIIAGLLTAAVCLAQGSVVFAKELDAGYITNKMSVRGDAGKYNANQKLTLLVLDSDADVDAYTEGDIKHIEQVTTDEDGKYDVSFGFAGSVDDCMLRVNLGGKEINETVQKAVSVMDMLDVKISVDKNDTVATANAEIVNRYNLTGRTCRVVMAFYNGNGTLLGTAMSDTKAIAENGTTTDTTNMTMPQGTEFIKAMVWDMNETMIPLANSKVLGDERIVCWGDSLTEGAGGEGTTYGSVLEALSGRQVINKGIGGQTATQIAVRQGGVKLLAAEGFTVPANTEPVMVAVKASTNTAIGNVWNDVAFNIDCSIDGIDGKLYSEGYEYYDSNSNKWYAYNYYFQREEAGREYTVDAGTPFISDDSRTLNDDAIAIIWVGTNAGWTNDDIANDYTTYVSYQAICDGMIDQLEVKDYIIVGLTAGKEADYQNMKSILTEKYGDRYLDMRSEITSATDEEFAKYGIPLTEEDKALMAEGTMPMSMRIDGVHFNAAGYTMIGNIMYDHMVEIGLLNK